MNVKHPSSQELEEYVSGASSGVRAEGVERHVARCAACESRLVAEARLEERLHEAGQRMIRKPRMLRRRTMALAVASGLAVAAGLALFVHVPLGLEDASPPVSPEVPTAEPSAPLKTSIGRCLDASKSERGCARLGIARPDALRVGRVPRYERLSPSVATTAGQPLAISTQGE